MIFQLFFLTITISNRKLTEEDIRREQAHSYYEQHQTALHGKHTEYFRNI